MRIDLKESSTVYCVKVIKLNAKLQCVPLILNHITKFQLAAAHNKCRVLPVGKCVGPYAQIFD